MSKVSIKIMRSVFLNDSNKAFCNDCNGKGFLKKIGGRTLAHRKCNRCKGAGVYLVGSTKR
jgi:DnaJ-class molecular chaperone